MSENCIFCKIIKGEIPSYTVYEDEDFKAILDIAPSAVGHMLILPKKHADDLFALDAASAGKLIPLAQKLAQRVKEATGCAGVNLLQNNGAEAGQTVRHFHLHIIPRVAGDGILPEWAHLSPEAETFQMVMKRIAQGD